jgi:hypothetical protein
MIIPSPRGAESAAPDFYDIAEQFVNESAASESPHKTLRKWAQAYPEFAADLASIAFASFVLPPGSVDLVTEADLSDVLASAQNFVAANAVQMPPLISLIGAARSAGVSPVQFANALKIDILLLAKLEQRLLDVSTIPSRLLRFLAAEIQRSVDDITNYLSLPPQLATNAQYRSKKTPSVKQVKRQKFVDALSASTTLSSEDKRYWLDELETDG